MENSSRNRGAAMEAREVLTRFKEGKITLEEAEHYFRQEPFEEMEDYLT